MQPITTTATTQVLRDEFEQAMLTKATREHFEISPVLLALDRLLIKTKRIAAALGISRPQVSMMLAGVRQCPEKYERKLVMLLRDAIFTARETVAKAEQGQLEWDKYSVPQAAISFFQARIAEAEKVLKQHEKSES